MEICNQVFVYGTLQEGYGNNRILLSSEKVGPAVTREKYVLGTVGFPYMFKAEWFPEELHACVKGELWVIDSEETLKRMDALEGHPYHYTREVIELQGGEKAWAYLQQDQTAVSYCYQCNINEEGNYEW